MVCIDMIFRIGGEVDERIRKDTNYLIVSQDVYAELPHLSAGDKPKKVKEAEKYGVNILSEVQWREIMRTKKIITTQPEV